MEFKRFKAVRSENYNYNFDRETGEFARWGKTLEDDPVMAPAPEIADIEVSTICSAGCKACYKSNTTKGKNMDLETFKKVFHNLGKNICQVALGIGDIDTNPDLYKIMEYCRDNDYNYVVPNVTINGQNLNDYHITQLTRLCGAVAVSNLYGSKTRYIAIKKKISPK